LFFLLALHSFRRARPLVAIQILGWMKRVFKRFALLRRLVLERTFSPHFSTTAGYFYFFTGQFLHETPPGKGVGYFYATITFRF
jgi:hypothetical protein